jgi:hypothetical protein
MQGRKIQSSVHSATSSERTDLAERARMFGKLFTLYPQQKDMLELRARAYIDETRDVPAWALSHGLQRLVRKKTDFAPSVAEIRKECALFVRERHRLANGLDPSGWNPHTDAGEIDVERWLQRSSEQLRLPALTSGAAQPAEVPVPKTEKERAIAILDAEIARLERRMRVKP